MVRILAPLARNLRKNATDVERAVWRHLRAKRFAALKFRRQEVIGPYIVDFVCFKKRIIVELDGGQHNEEQGKRKDKERDHYLKDQGFTVVRYWNNEVLENLALVLEDMYRRCNAPLPNPPPRGGRE